MSHLLRGPERLDKLLKTLYSPTSHHAGFPDSSVIKNLPANAGDAEDAGSILGPERSSAGGNGNPLQDSFLVDAYGQRNLVSYSPWGCKNTFTCTPAIIKHCS